MTPITPPTFHNTSFRHEYANNISGSHKDNETYWLLNNIISTKPFGVVSTGNAAISLAKLVKNSHIFVPERTPQSKLTEINKYTNDIYLFGKNYAECYTLADDYMHQNDIINVTAGKVNRYLGNFAIVDDILRSPAPDFLFTPASNLDLATSLAKRFHERNTPTSVIACVLPDHPKSPRFFSKYDHDPYSSCITFDKYNIPALNKNYRLQSNLAIATVKNPDYVLRKYSPIFPNLDPVTYIAMEVAEKFNSNGSKLILLTGERRK